MNQHQSPYSQSSTTFPSGGAPYPPPAGGNTPYPTGPMPMPMPQVPSSNPPYPMTSTNAHPGYPPAPAPYNPSAPYPIDRNMDPPPYNQVVFPAQIQQNYEKQSPYNPNY